MFSTQFYSSINDGTQNSGLTEFQIWNLLPIWEATGYARTRWSQSPCKPCKVKQSHYSPWQALRVPGVWGSQISRQSAHEGGKVVSPTHRPPLPRGYIPVRGWVNEKSQCHHRELKPQPSGLYSSASINCVCFKRNVPPTYSSGVFSLTTCGCPMKQSWRSALFLRHWRPSQRDCWRVKLSEIFRPVDWYTQTFRTIMMPSSSGPSCQ